MRTFNIYCDESCHNEELTFWIHEHLYSTNLPNKETLQAVESVEKGKDLIEAKDADDLFRKLGI